MATIRASTEAADAIPQFWLSEALGYLRDEIVLAGLVRRDVDDVVAEEGDTINVTKRGALSVQTPAENAALVPEGPTTTKIPIVLNQYAAVTWQATDLASAKAVDDAINYAQDAAAKLAEHIEQSIAAEYANFTTTKTGTDGVSGITLANIISTRIDQNKANVPRSGRAMVIHPDAEEDLLNLDKLTDVDRAGTSMALREAMLGRLYGYDVYSSNNVAQSAYTLYIDVVDDSDGDYEVDLSGFTGTTATFAASSDTIEDIADGLATDIDDDALYTASAAQVGTTSTYRITVTKTDGSVFTYENLTSPSSGLEVTSAGVHLPTHNMAFHPDAITLAMRPLPLPPAGSGAVGAYIVDPESGLAMRFMQQYDLLSRGLIQSIDVLYGVKLVDERLAQEVLS